MDQRIRDLIPGYYFNHVAFRKDIDRLSRAAEKMDTLSPGQIKDVQKYFAFAVDRLVGHHELEDKYIFPKVRSDFPKYASEIEALEEEHHELDHLIDRVKEALAQDTSQFPGALRELSDHLLKHLEREEKFVLASILDAPDGAAYSKELERDMHSRLSSTEKKHMQSGLAWLADAMNDEEKAVFFTKYLPFFVVWIYKLFLKKQFEKQVVVFQ